MTTVLAVVAAVAGGRTDDSRYVTRKRQTPTQPPRPRPHESDEPRQAAAETKAPGNFKSVRARGPWSLAYFVLPQSESRQAPREQRPGGRRLRQSSRHGFSMRRNRDV
jgi:hypothetical protein